MKRLILTLLLLLLTSAVLAGEKAAGLTTTYSSWVLSVGGAVGSDSGVVTADGGWYVGFETPALASSWTVAGTYQDLGTRFAQVGTRRYVGTRNTWFWFGFGVGAAKLDVDFTDYAPGVFVEGGLSWELTEHISWELAGDVGGWHATSFEYELRWPRCQSPTCNLETSDSWEVLPKVRTGVGFVF